jgi:hypothetical protein
MCDKCEQLDKKIEHYQKLLLGIADQPTVDRINPAMPKAHWRPLLVAVSEVNFENPSFSSALAI